jgi:hypothetical protein
VTAIPSRTDELLDHRSVLATLVILRDPGSEHLDIREVRGVGGVLACRIVDGNLITWGAWMLINHIFLPLWTRLLRKRHT